MTPVNATLACKLQGICVFPSNKPWITKDIQLLLKACNTVFRSGDMQTWSIRDAKAAYKWRIEDHFGNWDPRRAWQGIRHNIVHSLICGPVWSVWWELLSAPLSCHASGATLLYWHSLSPRFAKTNGLLEWLQALNHTHSSIVYTWCSYS